MIPLLLSPPSGRSARVLGAGKEILPCLQDLGRVGWPVVLHEPAGGGPLQGYPGIQVQSAPPPGPALRQASLVLITSGCPADWRDAARRELEGSGVPLWDASDPGGSTLAFPIWFPGFPLSLAFWTGAAVQPWERLLAEEFMRHLEGFVNGYLRLTAELRGLVFEKTTDEAFRTKVVTQIQRPEILALLLKGEYDQAKTLALKVIGTTTRSLE
jgi:hypothetical protein